MQISSVREFFKIFGKPERVSRQKTIDIPTLWKSNIYKNKAEKQLLVGKRASKVDKNSERGANCSLFFRGLYLRFVALEPVTWNKSH